MRWLFSLVGLLVVVYLVMQLGKTQVQQLQASKPAAGSASSVGANPAANAGQQVQNDVQKALAQGMQQRASEPGQ
ncbi:MAG: hypothetical protein H7Z19_05250 [Chitinophagaceae bacterium]|nr:hypothetical protein [Rubrivivax sp.]